MVGNGEKTVRFWDTDRGIVKELSSTSETKELKQIIWPGDSVTQPKGWAISNLRVGVPWKSGFREFLDVLVDPATNHTNAVGFAVDIFLASLQMLPFPVNYEFQDYNETDNINWTYENVLRWIPEKFDMVVGDTTIWAPRAEHVEFSLPYSESEHQSAACYSLCLSEWGHGGGVVCWIILLLSSSKIVYQMLAILLVSNEELIEVIAGAKMVNYKTWQQHLIDKHKFPASFEFNRAFVIVGGMI